MKMHDLPVAARRGYKPVLLAAALTLLVLAAMLALTPRFGGHFVRRSPHAVVHATASVASPPAAPPLLTVAPVNLMSLTPDQARIFNAGIAFSAAPNPPARPLNYVGTAADRENALTCLASAVLYEAGDDPLGQQAVAQVVLNRLRHPAFPKTVCGVVFQGSDRKTGCQFTFTCDGSLARILSAAAWTGARAVASKALTGFVFKPVGLATHYHTNWVVPYWYASLDKITEVHSQIFYRWQGGWGRPAAFTGAYQSPETADALIASHLDPAQLPAAERAAVADAAPHAAATAAVLPVAVLPILSEGILKGSVVRLADLSANTFVLQLDPAAYPGSYAVVAFGICKGKPHCLVMGWTHADQVPAQIPTQISTMPSHGPSPAFVFRYDGFSGEAHPAWDCRTIARSDASECLPGTAAAAATH